MKICDFCGIGNTNIWEGWSDNFDKDIREKDICEKCAKKVNKLVKETEDRIKKFSSLELDKLNHRVKVMYENRR